MLSLRAAQPHDKAFLGSHGAAVVAEDEDGLAAAASCSSAGASRTTGLLTNSGFRSVGPGSALALATTAVRAAPALNRRACSTHMLSRLHSNAAHGLHCAVQFSSSSSDAALRQAQAYANQHSY